jgi:hypothetical protein
MHTALLRGNCPSLLILQLDLQSMDKDSGLLKLKLSIETNFAVDFLCSVVPVVKQQDMIQFFRIYFSTSEYHSIAPLILLLP